MKGGNLSRHKKTKLGMLPGDIPIQEKALMLEKGIRVIGILPEDTERMDPTGELGRRVAKSYKKKVAKMANRRARRAPIENEE